MSLPPASPRKRPRHLLEVEPEDLRHVLGAIPPTPWSSSARNFRGAFITLYNDFLDIPCEGLTPGEVMYHYNKVYIVAADICMLRHLHHTIRKFAKEHEQEELLPLQEKEVQAEVLPPRFTEASTNTDPPTLPTGTPPPAPPAEPAQPAMPETWAQVTSRQKPRNTRAKLSGPTLTAKTNALKTLSPVRVIADLQGQPSLGTHTPTNRELYLRLAEACSKVAKAPTLLGAHWTKKGNLILIFPPGASRNSIKPTFSAIRANIGSNMNVKLRFDAPWRKIHIAGIRVRDDLNSAIAAEEDLRQSLALNPAIQNLKITIQASWLKKPGAILGTHTSAVLAFEDPEGLVEQNLIKSTLYVFGERVTVKKWLDKPPAKKTRAQSPHPRTPHRISFYSVSLFLLLLFWG